MVKLLFLFIIILNFSVEVWAEPADRRSDIRAMERLNDLRRSGECVDCLMADQGNSCFNFLEKLHRDDFSHTTVTIQGGAAQCQSSIAGTRTEKTFASSEDLQKQFAAMYPELGTVNHNQIKACTSDIDESDAESRYKVSKFYYFMKKFNEAATTAVEEIASINKLIGDPAPMECIAKGTLPQSFKRCEELNEKCKHHSRGRGQKSQLEFTAEKSQEAEKGYLAIKKDIETIDKQCLNDPKDYQHFKGDLTEANPEVTQCKKILVDRSFKEFCTTYTLQEKQKIEECKKTKELFQVAMSGIEDENPWFRNKNYFEARKTKSVAQAIKENVLNNREELKKKIDEFQDAGLCFNGFQNSDKCNIPKIRKLLAATPEIPKSTEKDIRSLSANIYLGGQTCVEIKNEFNAEAVKVLWRGAFDMALVIGTAGATAGYQAAMLAKNATTIPSFLAVMTGFNGIATIESYINVAHSCNSTAQKISVAMQSEGKECPGPNSNVSQAESEHSGCMTAKAFAAINTLTLGLPFISPTMKAFADARRLQRAEAVLERPITPAQRNAITRAHEVGAGKVGRDGTQAAVGNYTLAQLREKAKILKDAGLSKEEVRTLMENSIVGLNPADASSFKKFFGGLFDEEAAAVARRAVVGQRVSIPRKAGGRSNGEIVRIEGDMATVHFIDNANGLMSVKSVKLSELDNPIPDVYIPAGPNITAAVPPVGKAAPSSSFTQRIPNAVIQNGLAPKHVVELARAGKLKVGDFFKDSSGRLYTVVEVEVKGKKAYYVYYRSNSQTVFRLLPAMNKGIDKPQIDKARSESLLTALPELQAYLSNRAIASEVNSMSTVNPLELEGIFRVNRTADEWLAYTRSPDFVDDQLVKVDRIVTDATRTERNAVHQTFPKPEDVRIPILKQPDFKVEQRSYEIVSPVYGKVKAHVYRSRDGSIEYTLMQDSENRIWFADVGYSSTHLTPQGLRGRAIDSNDLTMPLWEYHAQIPASYGSARNPHNSEYGSAWNYIRNMPDVRRWYLERGMEIPK